MHALFAGPIVSAIRGFIGQIPREVFYALAAFAAWWFFSSHYIGVGKDRCEAEYAKAEEEARIINDESANQATVERGADNQSITDNQEARDDAIRQAQDDAPSDASNALNCERLRRAGRDVSEFPACR